MINQRQMLDHEAEEETPEHDIWKMADELRRKKYPGWDNTNLD